MTASVNISGTWHSVQSLGCNLSGVWHTITAAYVNISGTWHQWFSSFNGQTNTYASAGTFTETIPVGASQVVIEASGSSGDGGHGAGSGCGAAGGGGGGSGSYGKKTLALTSADWGKTLSVTVAAADGAQTKVVSGTKTITSIITNGGAAGGDAIVGSNGAPGAAGAVGSGGDTNTAGHAGVSGCISGAGGTAIARITGTANPGGQGGIGGSNLGRSLGGPGLVTCKYT